MRNSRRPRALPHDPGHEECAKELVGLILRVAAGDRDAFHRIYDLEAPRLNAVALRITRCRSLAADAMQDAFLQVWRNAGRFDAARGDPTVWLASLVRYRAIDIVRRNTHELPIGDGLEQDGLEQPDKGPDALEQLMVRLDAAALRVCISKLRADRYRLMMLAFEGLSHAELAERVQAPLGTVKSHMRSSLKSLRLCLRERAYTVPEKVSGSCKC